MCYHIFQFWGTYEHFLLNIFSPPFFFTVKKDFFFSGNGDSQPNESNPSCPKSKEGFVTEKLFSELLSRMDKMETLFKKQSSIESKLISQKKKIDSTSLESECLASLTKRMTNVEKNIEKQSVDLSNLASRSDEYFRNIHVEASKDRKLMYNMFQALKGVNVSRSWCIFLANK